MHLQLQRAASVCTCRPSTKRYANLCRAGMRECCWTSSWLRCQFWCCSGGTPHWRMCTRSTLRCTTLSCRCRPVLRTLRCSSHVFRLLAAPPQTSASLKVMLRSIPPHPWLTCCSCAVLLGGVQERAYFCTNCHLRCCNIDESWSMVPVQRNYEYSGLFSGSHLEKLKRLREALVMVTALVVPVLTCGA